MPRRGDIQGLRAVAVLMVLVFHAGLPFPGGFAGVDVFFVISGFVIADMLHREYLTAGRIDFRRFYTRRFKRLTPALALVVTVTVFASALILSPLGPQQVTAQTGLGAMFFIANFVIARTTGGYFDAPAEANPLLNTWSLSVEEQFYLVFPALLAFAWMLQKRKKQSRPYAIWLVAAVALVSFLFAQLGSQGFIAFPGSTTLFGFYSPFTRAWEFAVGALIALSIDKVRNLSDPLLSSLAVIGLLMVVASLWLISDDIPYPGLATLLPVVGASCVIVGGTGAHSRTSKLLALKPLQQLGDWSYSIYLWHWPFIVFAAVLFPNDSWMLLGFTALSFLPAISSFRWIEQPIRNASSLRPSQWAVLCGVVMVPPIALSAGLATESHMRLWPPAARQLREATGEWHAAASRGCDDRTPLGRTLPDDCTWNGDLVGTPVYLLGDSNADQFSEALIQATTVLGRPLTISTSNTCPFLDVYFENRGQPSADEPCRQWVQESIDFLRDSTPGTVVISNSDEYWTSENFATGLTEFGLSLDTYAKLRHLDGGLESTIGTIQTAGHDVIILQSIPKWPLWEPNLCSLRAVLSGDCRDRESLTALLQPFAGVRATVDRAARRSNANLWDPGPSICPNSLCSTEGPGFVRYRDKGHISVPQSLALTPAILRLLREAGLKRDAATPQRNLSRSDGSGP